jgi:hypothetical protein
VSELNQSNWDSGDRALWIREKAFELMHASAGSSANYGTCMQAYAAVEHAKQLWGLFIEMLPEKDR